MSFQQSTFSVADYTRSILSILLFFLLLLLFTPIIFLLLVMTLGKASNFVVESIAPAIAKPVLKMAGVTFRIKKYVKPIPAPAVYVVNHSSTLDVLTILALGLPRVRFVAKWQIQYNPIFLILGRLTGQVFIRREESNKAVETLRKSVKRIKKNKLSLLMAPEGSRKHPGIIGPFKKGPFRMAIDLKYPIVPVYFEGNRELCSGDFLVTKKGTSTAHIFPPVDTSAWEIETIENHINEVRSIYLDWANIRE